LSDLFRLTGRTALVTGGTECMSHRLANLGNARLGDMNLAMRIKQWLGRPAVAFIHLAGWWPPRRSLSVEAEHAVLAGEPATSATVGPIVGLARVTETHVPKGAS
jgi:hypothetical protein